MKKILAIIAPLTLIGLLLGSQMGMGTYGVTVGSMYVFDCVESTASITVGENSATAQGYEIDGHHFDPGTSVTVNVTSISSSVYYDKMAGGYTESASSSSFGFVFGSIFLMMYPYLLAVEFGDVGDWNQTEAEEDPGMLLTPFVENETSTWEGFRDLADDVATGSLISETGDDELTINATYTENTQEFIFEFFLAGTLDHITTSGNQTLDLTGEIENHYQFAIEKPTGIMEGIRLEGFLTGTSNGTAIDIQYNFLTELEGYDLPPLEFGDGGFTFPFPGFGIYITLGALGTLTIIAVMVRRRK
ncbi:MAG: choice-of-anchor S family protein [Asgard group archaeon]|nr:choice-of-anchor S family protein [Asgard group archaeon]